MELVDNDGLRVAFGTAPGTVPGVARITIRAGNRMAIPTPTSGSKCRGIVAAILAANLEGVSGAMPIEICRGVCAVTRSATLAATLSGAPVAIYDVACAAIR